MPNQLTNLKLNEVSLVDSPANKHARVMLFKRATPAATDDGNYPSSILKREFSDKDRKRLAETGAAMPGGGYPIEDEADLKNAIRAIGRAKNPAKTKAHIRSRAKSLGLTDLIPETWGKRDSGNAALAVLAKCDAKAGEIAKGYGDGQAVDFDQAQEAMEESEAACGLMDEVNEAVCALSTAMWSINADDTITDKSEAIQQCLAQFGEHVKTIVPEGVENALVAESLSQAGYTINPLGGIELSKGADSMLKAIAKSLGLADTATEADILAKMAENAKKAAADAAIAKMSARHKDFMDKGGKMPSGGKEAFANMEPGERDEHISKNPLDDDEDDVEKAVKKGDAFRTEGGQILRKKDFGTDAGFQFAKQQAADNAVMKADLAKAKDEAEEKKKKEEAEKSLSKIGKSDEIGSLLFRISKHDAKLADETAALLKHAAGLVEKGTIFTEFGKAGHGATGSALEQINKGAAELLRTEPALKTIEKARTAYRTRNPEVAKREQEEAKIAKAAA